VPPDWDVEADVVVVGFGAAGACAALEAAAACCSVLILDRFGGGGATALSGGVVYAGGGTAQPYLYVPKLGRVLHRPVGWLERRYARPLRVGATRGVILAVGGFAASRADDARPHAERPWRPAPGHPATTAAAFASARRPAAPPRSWTEELRTVL
jgi:choline dehydrogenase-like flavoprotein